MTDDGAGVRSMSVGDLKQRLDRGETLVVLDVREDDERGFCSIAVPEPAGDLHIPLGQIQDRFEFIRQSAEGEPLVIYCHHGVRSLAAARWLALRGIDDVYNLEGGIDFWSAGVDPDVPRY